MFVEELTVTFCILMHSHPFPYFTRWNNFFDFLVSQRGRSPTNMGSTLKGKNLLLGMQVFPIPIADPFEEKGKNENNQVAFPEEEYTP